MFAKRSALAACRRVCGRLPIAEFGPLRLQEVRQTLVERGLKRNTVNHYVRDIIAAFKWGVSQERVSPHVVTSLECVRPFRKGEASLSESEEVEPVPEDMIEAVRPFVSDQVWSLIQLQCLTGARQGELVVLRPMDIDRSGSIWRYRPGKHKTSWRERKRQINFGPQSQAILQPYLDGRPDDVYLFSPREAEEARRAKQRAARRSHRSTNKTRDAQRREAGRAGASRAGDRYTSSSYRKAIERACDKAYPAPEGLEGDELKAWRDEHSWHPHQLRHNAATNISHRYDLERAKLVLEHSSAELTDAIYAKRDSKLIDEAVLEMG